MTEPKKKRAPKQPGPRTIHRNPRPVGRPRTTLQDLPANWKELMREVAQGGGSMTEIMCKLGIHNHAWDTLLTDYEDFRAAVSECRMLCQVWWETVGRKLSTGADGNATAWTFNMKNRFGWKDKTELSGDPSAPMQHEVKKKALSKDELLAELEARGLPTTLLKD